MNSDEELRKLFIPAKRKAVALFKNDHDDGDTAIYQFITDIIPLLQDRDTERDAYVLQLDADALERVDSKVDHHRSHLPAYSEIVKEQQIRAKQWSDKS